ncbi:lipoyl domain-containing protein [Haloechinothrix salitolerans]|uniref:Lipoyl domain-containing protein n=1 Tax=Haloechinothrix salitolerans TaxID=926830 RepID=A0ABW2C1F5_9PSEU
MIEVPFPALSDTPDTEGVVATWFVTDGQTVTKDQLIAEVQVDKASAEVPAPAAGTVHLFVPEEAVVPQGKVIARIDT